MAANTFEEKSDKTFESAELLVSNNQKNSSIHCYYYSCYQLLNHFLCAYCHYTERDIKELTKGKDSHNIIINEVKRVLYENGKNGQHILRDLTTLKMKRKDADYGMAFVIDISEVKQKSESFRKNFKFLFDEF